ncbi:ABC-F family ATP-binding cassette domain-containing protein [Actinopolymorpha sp. B9G3]|uniref:ABC-F family ATP-binding cassette domain-containing protein n=1 Tax=Actinopolymorpha sp. B9G3 TaxID=3158970 RepID=UPI0032D91A35
MNPVNLVNLERVEKAYGVERLLDGVSLGVAAGERIGIVGRNGAGKTTLLALLAQEEVPDAGRVTLNRGLRVGRLGQRDDLDPGATVASVVLGGRAEHEWMGDRKAREVLAGLLADVPTDRVVGGLSGGERRRVALAALLVDEHDLLLLDEPTNHLDLEVTDWLARHLVARGEAVVAVTHDRWFLDAVCTTTWELDGGSVAAYDGGYAAYVLARAERERMADATETKRQNLLRKELAWLRRGAPARTSKPKFRLDAASALIADEPDPRDSLALAKFASARLGKQVIDLTDVDVVRGSRELLRRVTWQLGPGDRIGIVGVNGAGKTTLLRLLAGEDEPAAGKLAWGRTVQLGHLAQELGGLDDDSTVVDAAEGVRRVVKLRPGNVRPGAIGRRPVPTSGPEVTAMSLLERFGFRGDLLRARVGDLSGGERRRLELLCLLLDEPNVLLLDEPTNDLDIDTLRVVEDFLDGFAGSVVVVTHDRYFLERVCDTVWALLGDGSLGMLPGGVEEYLARRRDLDEGRPGRTPVSAHAGESGRAGESGGGSGVRTIDASELRAAKKELARLERQLTRLSVREEELHAALAAHASDYERLMKLDEELRTVRTEKDSVETRWLELAEAVD